jgi:two-component system CheB/CheR fusion protein
MMEETKILILEDNKSDADLLLRELKKSGLAFTAEVVQTRAAFENALQHFRPNIIISDYSLPSFDAVTAFRIKEADYPLIPFIIVSGIIGEENAVELIKEGVTDYAPKGRLFTLPVKIARALKDAEEKKEKIIIDKKLKIQTAELIAANKELVVQNMEKEQRAVELVNLSESLRTQKKELRVANDLLLIQDVKVQAVNEELLQLNQELELRVADRTKALSESEHRFRKMMETIPQIAWTNTLNGEFIYYNQRWFDYTGFSYEQGKEGGLLTAIHPEDLKKSSGWFNMIRDKGEGGEFQLRLKKADGLYRWHLLRIMPIKGEQGELQLWVGTATDIEELRLLQQQKDDFINIASHELKTPLTSLKVSLQFLDRMKDKPSPIMSPMIVQANKSLNKVNALVEDLLYTSKLNQEQLHINPRKFALAGVIQDACQFIRSEGVYDIQTDGDIHAEIFADPVRIDQIVTNFITNAIKYAPESKVIIIYIAKLQGRVKVSVIDKGPGIPEEKQRFLFDRYYRVDNRGSHYTGLGLGLYICSQIIKAHDGEIGVVSKMGEGCEFWFTLPAA